LSEMSAFAQTILNQKYAMKKEDGTLETWDEIAHRVSKNVLKSVGASKNLIGEIQQIIAKRKFIPGGRYLYATGRPYHQVNNCLLMKAEDSRESWAELMQKSTMALMTGAGIGVDYSSVRGEGKLIRKTGGHSTGPLALMQMVNEAGRGIRQGGSRRSALWAGLKWSHPDVQKFITAKNWILEVRALKEKDFNFPANMDGTNISVQLDDEFFKVYNDENHPLNSHAQSVYWSTIRQMLKTAEPGFSIDVGKNVKETLRNAPVSGSTFVLTEDGLKKVIEIVDRPVSIWTGKRFAPDVVFKKTHADTPVVRVMMTGRRELVCDPSHPFLVERYIGAGENRKIESIERVPAAHLQAGDILHISQPKYNFKGADIEKYTLGFLYGDGYFRHTRSAEVTICSSSKVSSGGLVKQSSLFKFSTPDYRGYDRIYMKSDPYFENRKKAIFPRDIFSCTPWQRASFIAGLFDADGSYDDEQSRIRLSSIHFDFLVGVRRILDSLGILVGIHKGCAHSGYGSDNQCWNLVVMSGSVSQFMETIPCLRIIASPHESYRQSHIKVVHIENAGSEDVFCADVKVPEHSFMAEGVIVSNCTEITSEDDSDVCNLGSINMARIESLQDMAQVVELAIAFLLAGTVYSDVPYSKVDIIRGKNRRLGLGLMGIHEWLLKHGRRYEADEELGRYLEVYAKSTALASGYAKSWDLSPPIKTRAIAPTGTIGIIGETTTGCEPIFCIAYKRRYLKGSIWNYQYVIDPTAKRLIDEGIDPSKIEDAYMLSEDVERRIAFQAWLQQFVDHSISSTINLPAWGSELNNDSKVRDFGNILMKYLPKLRGITVYPEGARGGQPLTPIKLSTAMKHVGEVFIENEDICEITKGGSCGS
jgi:ribonucleotide reductase alpha subunit